jgi:ribA/ribD-fused uncharacterized protein
MGSTVHQPRRLLVAKRYPRRFARARAERRFALASPLEVTTSPLDLEDLQQRVLGGWQPKYVFFWGHTPARDGELGKECFSQWYPAPFELEGARFPSAEHYMMWSKARLFGDEEVARQALGAKSAAEVKKLGRAVRGFDEASWLKHRFEIVVRASVGKFAQNPALLAYLHGTGERVLVEASPVDRIWGIGLSADDPHVRDPAQWQGLNLLGFALMRAREVLGEGPLE